MFCWVSTFIKWAVEQTTLWSDFQSTDWVESSLRFQITESRRKEVERLRTSESNTNSSVFSIVKRQMKNSLYTQMVKVGSSESRHSFFLATFTSHCSFFLEKKMDRLDTKTHWNYRKVVCTKTSQYYIKSCSHSICCDGYSLRISYAPKSWGEHTNKHGLTLLWIACFLMRVSTVIHGIS